MYKEKSKEKGVFLYSSINYLQPNYNNIFFVFQRFVTNEFCIEHRKTKKKSEHFPSLILNGMNSYIHKYTYMEYHSWRIPTIKNLCLLFKIKTFSAFQDHKSRSVQFRTCVKYVKLNASCELHRPAFMTLEPIRFC